MKHRSYSCEIRQEVRLQIYLDILHQISFVCYS